MNQNDPKHPEKPSPPADPKRERLAAALRDNLKRRKQQGKARRTTNAEVAPGDPVKDSPQD